MISKFPSAMREMARLMPRAMLMKSVRDLTQEKVTELAPGVKRDDLVAFMEGLSADDLDRLLKAPEQILARHEAS